MGILLKAQDPKTAASIDWQKLIDAVDRVPVGDRVERVARSVAARGRGRAECLVHLLLLAGGRPRPRFRPYGRYPPQTRLRPLRAIIRGMAILPTSRMLAVILTTATISIV